MRGLIVGLMLLTVPALAADKLPPIGELEAHARPINCKQKSLPLSYPEKLICQRLDLRRTELQVYKAFRDLLPVFKSQDLLVFVAGQNYAMDDLEGCPYLDGRRTNDHPTTDEIARCLKGLMDQRLVFLAKLKANPAMLQSTVADYDGVDYWYIKLFPRQFEGKRVRLDAVVLQDSPICKVLRLPQAPFAPPGRPGMSLKARLQEWPEQDFMNAQFAGINQTVNYACTARPYLGAVEGVVKLDEKGKPYLYISEMGEQPLHAP